MARWQTVGTALLVPSTAVTDSTEFGFDFGDVFTVRV